MSYTPDGLWAKAQEYFDWCVEHPWQKNEAVKSGDNAGMIISIPTATPFTLKGLCLFAGIDFKTFENYSKNEEFIHITTRIRDICYTQKFEGAAVGAFNPNIIARDLGLVDKTEQSGGLKITFVEPGDYVYPAQDQSDSGIPESI